jgi:hypothetical protein
MMGHHETLWNLLNFVSQRMEHPIPLIFAFENAERVQKPYGSIRIDTITLPGHEIAFPVHENGYQDYGGWRRATVELQVYGRLGGPIAREFALRLQANSAVEQSQRLNIAIGNRLFLSEVPALLNQSQYEERGIYQFQYFFSEQLDDDVGLIETVIIDSRPIGGKASCHLEITAFPPHTPPHPTP